MHRHVDCVYSLHTGAMQPPKQALSQHTSSHRQRPPRPQATGQGLGCAPLATASVRQGHRVWARGYGLGVTYPPEHW